MPKISKELLKPLKRLIHLFLRILPSGAIKSTCAANTTCFDWNLSTKSRGVCFGS